MKICDLPTVEISCHFSVSFQFKSPNLYSENTRTTIIVENKSIFFLEKFSGYFKN